MKTLDEIFDEATEFPYPDNFDFGCYPPLEPFDQIIILSKSEVEFLKEEGLWEEQNPYSWGDYQEGIVLPHPDSEERDFEDYESVVCIKTMCPKEGTFFDYIALGHIVTNEDFYKIVKKSDIN